MKLQTGFFATIFFVTSLTASNPRTLPDETYKKFASKFIDEAKKRNEDMTQLKAFLEQRLAQKDPNLELNLSDPEFILVLGMAAATMPFSIGDGFGPLPEKIDTLFDFSTTACKLAQFGVQQELGYYPNSRKLEDFEKTPPHTMKPISDEEYKKLLHQYFEKQGQSNQDSNNIILDQTKKFAQTTLQELLAQKA